MERAEAAGAVATIVYNNAPGKPLAINVPGTIAGALIDLYDGNALIGSATATGSTTAVPVTGITATRGVISPG